MRKIFYSFVSVVMALVLGTSMASADITPKTITNTAGEVYSVTPAMCYQYYQDGWVTNGSGGAITSDSYFSGKDGKKNTEYINPETDETGTTGQGKGMVIKPTAQPERSVRFYVTCVEKISAYIAITGDNRTATLEIHKVSDGTLVDTKSTVTTSKDKYEMLTIDGLSALEDYYALVYASSDLCLYAVKFYAGSTEPVYTNTVTLDRTSVSLNDNDEAVALSATVDEGYNQGLVWASSNENIVTVDENGVVTPVFGADGTATVTVTAKSAEDAEVTASCAFTVAPHAAVPVLEASVASVSVVSSRINAGVATVGITGVDLTGAVSVTDPEVEGLTVALANGTIDNGSLNATFTISYQSNDDVAATTVNVTVAAGETTVTIPVTYSSTAAITEITPISGSTTWDWNGANNSNIQLVDGEGRNQDIVLANFDGWKSDFNAAAIVGSGEYPSRDKKFFQGGALKFKTTVPGKVTVVYSNTGNRDAGKSLERSVKVNGVSIDETGSISASAGDPFTSGVVPAGEVEIRGYMVADNTDQYVRIYNVVFTPAVAVTMNADKICTFSSSFDVKIPEGIEAWTLAEHNDGVVDELVLEQVTGHIQGGLGVILTGEADDYEFVYNDETSVTSHTSSIFEGTCDTPVTLTQGEAYILGKNSAGNVGLHLNAAGTIGVNKAYLPRTVIHGNPSQIKLHFPGNSSGIESVAVDAEIDGAAYNVLGQKVTDNYKGFVIKNGVKSIRK